MIESTHFKVGANLPVCYSQRDQALWPLVVENFQAITPARNFSVKRCYETSENPDFEVTDWLCEKIKNSGLELHGHCLLHGDFAVGRWRELNNYEFEQRVKNSVQEICDRYKGKVAEWEFLGEVVSPVGGLTKTLLNRQIGLNFPTKIFKWIREVDPDTPLYYTDYGLESPNKLESVMRFCEYLLSEGCNLAGVSIQYHHNTRGAINRVGLKRAIKSFQSLFLETKIGEVTIWRDLATLGGLAEEIQSHCYESVLDLAITTKCQSLTFWTPFDAYAWKLPERFPGLWDFDLEPTKSLEKVKKRIKALKMPEKTDIEKNDINLS